jgi:hypothetical protein
MAERLAGGNIAIALLANTIATGAYIRVLAIRLLSKVLTRRGSPRFARCVTKYVDGLRRIQTIRKGGGEVRIITGRTAAVKNVSSPRNTYLRPLPVKRFPSESTAGTVVPVPGTARCKFSGLGTYSL